MGSSKERFYLKLRNTDTKRKTKEGPPKMKITKSSTELEKENPKRLLFWKPKEDLFK